MGCKDAEYCDPPHHLNRGCFCLLVCHVIDRNLTEEGDEALKKKPQELLLAAFKLK